MEHVGLIQSFSRELIPLLFYAPLAAIIVLNEIVLIYRQAERKGNM